MLEFKKLEKKLIKDFFQMDIKRSRLLYIYIYPDPMLAYCALVSVTNVSSYLYNR